MALNSCLRSLQGLVARLKDPFHRTEADESALWVDELGRLRIWAANIGAHKRGQSSLEYRLRDASHIKDQVKNLLRDLRHTIRDAEDFIREQESPPVSPGLEAPEDFQDKEDVTELDQLRGNVSATIKNLFQMSMLIRQPASHDILTKVRDIDCSAYERFDQDHLRNKFPEADGFLLERLCRSMLSRRRVLKYRERHHQRLSKGIRDDDDAGNDDDHQTLLSSTVATTFMPSRKPIKDKLDDQSNKSDLTETSYASTLWHSGHDSIPQPPKKPLGDDLYECPYCFYVVRLDSSRAWYKHLFSDLKPYVCVMSNCTIPNKMYATQHEWIQHLNFAHKKDWPLNAYSLTSSKRVTRGTKTQAQCPLCGLDTLIGKPFERHVAHHMQEVACFVLPRPEADSDGSLSETESSEPQSEVTNDGSHLSASEEEDVENLSLAPAAPVRHLSVPVSISTTGLDRDSPMPISDNPRPDTGGRAAGRLCPSGPKLWFCHKCGSQYSISLTVRCWNIVSGSLCGHCRCVSCHIE